MAPKTSQVSNHYDLFLISLLNIVLFGMTDSGMIELPAGHMLQRDAYLFIDTYKVEQVIRNLITNAVTNIVN